MLHAGEGSTVLTPDRIEERTQYEPNTGCWLWTGATDNHGYGVVRVNKSVYKIHVEMWTTRNGPVPDGKILDHKCRVPLCINPEHLEPVTIAENVLRGNGPTAINKRKSVCIRGHQFDRIYKGYRRCKQCQKILNARRYAPNSR